MLLVSSTGGVLLDLLALEPWWSRYDATWAAVRGQDTMSNLADKRVVWLHDVSMRRPASVLRGFAQAVCLIRRVRPELIVSAGSGPVVPVFALARVLGIPTFWISTFNVLTTPGVSGRLGWLLASRVFVQHQASLRHCPDGVYLGELY